MKYKRLYLKLSESEVSEAIERFHFQDHPEMIENLLPKLDLWIKPECYYIYEKNCQDFVTVIVSLGPVVDRYNHSFQEQEHFLQAHAMDCLCLSLLTQSYEKVKEIIHREKRQFVTDMFFPDEDMIPDIIETFKKESTDFPIHMNEAGALTPSKTVVFQGKLSQYHEEASHSCSSCNNRNCPFRNNLKSRTPSGVLAALRPSA